MGKTVPAFVWLWRKRLAGGVALRGLCVSLIGKLLMSLWICAGIMLRKAAAQLTQYVFEPMVMSIMLAQQVRIQKLERQLKEASEKSGEIAHG